ncbi:hypothetical protein BN1723_020363, partial [Verticillium longisporum]
MEARTRRRAGGMWPRDLVVAQKRRWRTCSITCAMEKFTSLKTPMMARSSRRTSRLEACSCLWRVHTRS